MRSILILPIANVLDADRLAQVRDLLAQGRYVDGKQTAGWHARLVKDNEQLAAGEPAREAGAIVRKALLDHEVFRAAVLPHNFRPLLFSRYESGMAYGTHVDNAVMGGEGERVRSDISFTVFLSTPESYDGGELVIETTGSEQAFKLPAGSAIVYPSTTLHRVAPVTRGRREVAVSWVQSMVRAAEQREILFDLETTRRALFKRDGKSAEFDLLSKTHANLLRLWAEI
jgi:PKHD-type hydroxylase